MTTAMMIAGCAVPAVLFLAATWLAVAAGFTSTPATVSKDTADKAYRRAITAAELHEDIRSHTVQILACGFGLALFVEVIPTIFSVISAWMPPEPGVSAGDALGGIFAVSAVVLVVATSCVVLLLPLILSQVVALQRCRVPAGEFAAAEHRMLSATTGS